MSHIASEKTGQAPSNRAASPGASILLIVILFLERFCYYGVRSMMFLVISDYISPMMNGANDLYIYGFSMTLTVLVPAMAGMVLDTMLDKTTGLIAGGAFFGLGTLMLLGFNPETTIVGLSMIAVGSGFAKVSIWSYLGYLLPSQGKSLEGAYWIGWVVLNLAAMIAGLACVPLATASGPAATLVLVGILAMMIAGLAGLGAGIGLFPTESQFLQRPSKSVGMTLGGIIVMLLLVAVGSLMMALLTTVHLPSNSISGFIQAPLLLISLSASIGVMAAGRAKGRLVAIACAIGGMMMIGGMLMEIVNALNYRFDIIHSAENRALFELAPVVVSALALGIIFLASGKGGAVKLATNGILIFIGIAGLVLGGIASGLLSSLSGDLILIGLVIMGLAEGLWMPAMYSTLWRVGPEGRKGSAIGVGFGSIGLGSMFGNILLNQTDYLNGSQSGLLGIVAALLSILALGLSVGIWFMLRHHDQQEMRESNPFA